MKRDNRQRQRLALWLSLILMVILVPTFLITGCGNMGETTDAVAQPTSAMPVNNDEKTSLDPEGHYTSREEVALYLHLYGQLPTNYITKAEAASLGWEASKGNLWDVTDQKSIGGDRFGNREGLLPAKEGRQYYECDINYQGGYRGAERIVYSSDGLVYYTPDHYASFELLYGEE